MPSFCAIATCNDRYGHSENISFHKFPLKRLSLLKEWEAFIQKQRGDDWHASRWSSLCSRHFREDDFRSLNERRTLKKTAVPSILLTNEKEVNKTGKPKIKQADKIVDASENTREKEFKEILAIKERLEDTVTNATSTILNLPKAYCRLCGTLSNPTGNFLENFELYGLLQKCFPTINIQQEDTLPKVMCAFCHKQLEEFASFVDRVWTAQTELHRKFRTKTAEKPVKIKQEPLVRVKQEVAETGYDDRQDISGNGGMHEDYDNATDGGAQEGGSDQKFDFCDFPIINDCDIMEIINLDDPFINIPDDDNTTTQNEEDELLQKPMQESMLNYMPTAHELLQCHLLLEEHNYAYVDAEEFKEERQIYKTEKSDNDEQLMDYVAGGEEQQVQQPQMVSHNTEIRSDHHPQTTHFMESNTDTTSPKIAAFENRALKPIVTSVSAIQQPHKSSSNGIVVLNESIVKSGCGFQLHACMVCHLKFFSVESLKQHYTQTHGTPMVSVPGENIPLGRVQKNACKMEKEFTEVAMENKQIFDKNINQKELVTEPNLKQTEKENNLKETKTEEPDNFVEQTGDENYIPYQSQTTQALKDEIRSKINNEAATSNSPASEQRVLKSHKEMKNKAEVLGDCKQSQIISDLIPKTNNKNQIQRLKYPMKLRRNQNACLNTMANQYQQLRKLYQKLQKKCTSLEQNVEQLQSLPATLALPTDVDRSNATKDTVQKCVPKTDLQTNNVCRGSAVPTTNISTEEKKCKNTSYRKSIVEKKLRAPKLIDRLELKVATKKIGFTCTICSKSFSNSNSLRQHKITHSEERKHQCSLCQRSFKRRNGLLQHLKGFHLKVKPFACPVCNHSYALKCDMLRCKHSTLRNKQSVEKIKSRVGLKMFEK